MLRHETRPHPGTQGVAVRLLARSPPSFRERFDSSQVDREHPSLPVVRQCALLGVSRSSLYYRAKGACEADLSLMRDMDWQYLETPFYGSRRMKVWLERQGMPVSRKRVQRLMRVMGLRPLSDASFTGSMCRVDRIVLRPARVTWLDKEVPAVPV